MPDKPAPRVTDTENYPQYPSHDPNKGPVSPDVPNKTLKTLAQWAADLTRDKQDEVPPGTPTDNTAVNAYPIDPPNGPTVTTSPANEPVTGKYDPSLEFGGQNVKGLEKGLRRVGDLIKKGDPRSGHEYLGKAAVGSRPVGTKGIFETGLDPDVESYVMDGSLGPDGNPGILRNNKWTMNSQRSIDDPLTLAGQQVSQKDLRNIGITLTARASTEMNSADPNYDSSQGGPAAAAILPGWAQLAVKPVSLSDMDVMNVVLENLNVGHGPEEISVLAAGITGNGSYGQMNNPLDEYTGMSAVGMSALSVSLFLATSLVIEGISLVLKMVMKSTNGGSIKREDLKDEGDRYFLGVHGPRRAAGHSGGFPPLPMDSSMVANLLGLKQSKYLWAAAVEAGMLRFYGSEKTSMGFNLGSLAALGDMIVRAVESPGYYSVASRAIIRSGVSLIAALKDIFKRPIFVAVKDLIGFFDVMKQSKIIAAMNVFCAIGEAALDEASNKDSLTNPETSSGRYSSMDAWPNTVSSITKNRLKASDQSNRQTLKLAWSTNRSMSLLSTPAVLKAVLKNGVVDNGPAALLGVPRDSLSRTAYASGGSRLPTEAVELMERALDSEYVPFYFHDIRTNEILSFHAFLASLSDDYTVNWETTEPYGRVDPVRTYKNTHRKIGLSFYVVSTSPEDFDEMWVKLNKLTTLAYPQFTEGRTVETGDKQNRFIVPFSQLIGAGPLVRIRLGDLFRSNYSKFALARLFGMGSKTVEQAGANDLKIDGKSYLRKSSENVDNVKLNQILTKDGYASVLKEVVFFLDARSVTTADLIPKELSSTGMAMAVQALKDCQNYGVPLAVQVADPSKCGDGVFHVKPTQLRKHLYEKCSEMSDYLSTFVESLMVSVSALSTQGNEIAMFLGDKTTTSVTPEFNTFMEENAITKSFREVGGKGLAGVIDSIGFDWYDRVTWEIDKGRKAPKMCKVTVSFQPIHDIPPGLDHNGYNRAPLYPVGPSDGQSFTGAKAVKFDKDKLEASLKGKVTTTSTVGKEK